MRSPYLLTTLIFAISPAQVQASSKEDSQWTACARSLRHSLADAVLQRHKAIPRTWNKNPVPNAVLDTKRLEKVVHVLEPGAEADLGTLENGAYNYILFKDGSYGYLNRFIPPQSRRERGHYIGTHEGILKWIEKKFGQVPEVIAAGEFTVRDGQVVRLSNGSGTFMGESYRIDLAKDFMSQKGTTFAPDLYREDHTIPEKNRLVPHANAQVQVERDLEFFEDPIRKELLAQTRRLLKPLAKDWKKTEERLTDLYIAHMKDEKRVHAISAALYFFGRWHTLPNENDATIMSTFVTNMKPEGYRAMLKEFETLAGEIHK